MARRYKTGPNVDHGAKFHAGRSTHLDLALKILLFMFFVNRIFVLLSSVESSCCNFRPSLTL